MVLDGSFRELLAIVGDRLLVDQDLPDAWSARYHFEPDGGRLQLVLIEVRPGPDAVTISTAGVRLLSPAAAERTARRLIAMNPEVLRLVDRDLLGLRRWTPLTHRNEGAPRGQLTDLDLATIAYEYVRAIDQGERAPAAAIASHLGVRPVQARDYIRRARVRGFLGGASHGRAQGHLTPKAIALLRPLANRLAGEIEKED